MRQVSHCGWGTLVDFSFEKLNECAKVILFAKGVHEATVGFGICCGGIGKGKKKKQGRNYR